MCAARGVRAAGGAAGSSDRLLDELTSGSKTLEISETSYTQQTQLPPTFLEHAHGVHFKARREGPIIDPLHAAPAADREVQ